MARKTKYFFNPRSLEFEKVSSNLKYIAWRSVGFASLVLVLAILLAIFVAPFFASPREKAMAKQNRDMEKQLKIVSREVDEIEKELEALRERDLKVYRAIYEADPPKPIDYRGEDYEELLGMNQGKLVVRLRQKLDKLKVMSEQQEKSYQMITGLVRSREEMVNSVPAIQPILNEDLTRMASGFGYRIDPFTHASSFHPGMDFTADYGTEIFATGDGVVKRSLNDAWGYGIHIIIDHGFGYTTLYGHLSRMLVRPGQKVKRGQIIGRVGSTGYSTGPHLHYEVRKNDQPLNPAFFYYKNLSDADFKRMIELSKRETKSFD